MMKYIEHGGNKYPEWQSIGNAMQWIMPLAAHIITPDMSVVDIGFSKEQWRFPNAYGVDPSVIPEHGHAMNFKWSDWDAIISSHMLEHLEGNWADCLDYWLSKIKDGGVLFLYLPHSSQTYWHPTSNRKHIHSFDSTEIKAYLQSLGYDPYVTPVDYNNSFAVICYKTKVDKFADFKEQWAEASKIPGNMISEYAIKFGEVDSHGDVLMKGAFDKSMFANGKWDIKDHEAPQVSPFNPDAEKLEAELKAKGISYIRDGDMIMYNDVSPIKAPFDFKYNGGTIRVCIGGKYGNEIKDAATKSALEHGLVLWWITNPYSLPELTDITRLS